MVDDGNAAALVVALNDLFSEGTADLVDVDTADLVALVDALRLVVDERISVS